MKSPLRRRLAPSVPFVLKYEDETGKYTETFKVAYDWNALALVEEKLGKNMLLDIAELIDYPSVTNVSVLLWAGLQIYQPEYEGDEGLEIVRCNLTLAAAKEAKEACSAAYIKQLPIEQQEQLMAIQKAHEEGAVVPPLSPSPAPASSE